MFQEQELERLLRCPLLDPSYLIRMDAIRQLVNWALRKSFEGKFPGSLLPEQVLHQIRGRILEEYPTEGTLARVAGFRIFSMIMKYEVVHLEQPYNLVVSGYTIQGQYALLRKRTGAQHPHVLVIRDTEPELRATQAQPPEVVTLARLIHVLTTTQYTDARVLQFPVFRGTLWTTKDLKMPLAKSYLESMLKIASISPQFPIVGEHCSQCISKRCLEVFEK